MANKLKQYNAAKDLVDKPWGIRIANADKYYKQWESRFKCSKLEEYYEGFHWRDFGPNLYHRPYVLNLIYATIKIKLSNILIPNPEFNIMPVPGNADWNFQDAAKSAQLKQDVINTLISNPKANFTRTFKLAALDSFFRFGIIETNYAADWANPNKKSVVEDADGNIEKNKVNPINEDLPENERIYWKHIPAARFRVATNDSPFLNQCAWCGYYCYYYLSTLKKMPGVKLPEQYKYKIYSEEYSDSVIGAKLDQVDLQKNPEFMQALNRGEVMKVWKIWDNETNKFRMILHGSWDVIYEDDFERLPFTDLIHDERVNNGWYPIPPIWQWLSPQDEVNQAREQMRNYRRRFTRKFIYFNIDQEELEKFKSEMDGECIKKKSPNSSIEAVANPEIGISIEDGLRVAMGDMNIISGTSSEAQNQNNDRQTATATKITNLRAQIRESAEQIEFNKFMGSAAREGLLLAAERISSGFWVQMVTNPGDTPITAFQRHLPEYQFIYAQDLNDGYDFTIEINVTNATPAQQQDELQKMVTFFTLVNNFPQLAFDPDLIREAAYKSGYRNEKVISKMQQAAIMQLMAQAAQQAQQAGANSTQNTSGNNIASGRMQSQQPNQVEQIQAQLQNQV